MGDRISEVFNWQTRLELDPSCDSRCDQANVKQLITDAEERHAEDLALLTGEAELNIRIVCPGGSRQCLVGGFVCAAAETSTIVPVNGSKNIG